ncbi:RNB domain-containing ribonuclease [Nocardioides panacisoli]|uniref:RNB domain-containing ribonuclease n=1 Tax=Nocardioides panacisoli TaxID=627624 RepID=UPI001C6305BB|nr:RNB domain-containing ribonuclease [Nocardioides panacisoli]QYJ05459.1 RNB domain-containing ribonuclease [Nocardioides panacisoli]
MPSNVVVRIRSESPALREGLARIEDELDLPAAFPEEVRAAAAEAARGRDGSDQSPDAARRDLTDVGFVTIDPPGSMDLDQAMHLSREGDGYLVEYAIADVAAYVAPDGAIDREAHRRGETLYGADRRIPLHPPELSEDAASLLPDRVRPALVWRIALDAKGAITDVHVERALVRSVARWTYAEAHAAIADGSAGETLQLLAEIGPLREDVETARGGISLPLPEQEVVEEDGHFRLEFRQSLPVEGWNAQVSLLTGIAAARLMLQGGVGILRTLPEADPRDVTELRRVAKGLGVSWPADWTHAEFIRSLDPSRPAHQAMTAACTRLLRGSGYHAFDGELPEQTRHEAIAAEYAHVTAPLRRLGDRYALETCVALCAGEPVPDWVREALPGLPETLRDSARRAGAYESQVVNLLEAAVLRDHVGQAYDGVIVRVDDDGDRGVVVIGSLGVEARVRRRPGSTADLPLGESVTVRLVDADLAARRVEFEHG